MIEINCPPDCPHLAGESFQRGKVLNAILMGGEELSRVRELAEAIDQLGPLMQFLELTLVKWLPDLKVLTDRETAEALHLLRASYETEARGVLYQEASTNPLVQGLVRHLREGIERLRESDGERLHLPRLKPEWIAKALRGMEIELGYYAKTYPGSPRAYLSMLWRTHPARREDKGGSGLILASS